MRDILITLAVFFVAVAAHIIWCRVSRKQDLQIDVFIFFALSFLAGAWILRINFFPESFVCDPVNFWNLPLRASSIIFYFLNVFLYLIFYFNTQVESPSQRILRLCERKEGARMEELEKAVTDDDFIMTRLNDLKRYGYVEQHAESYRLLPRGVRVARLLSVYQKITGRPKGG